MEQLIFLVENYIWNFIGVPLLVLVGLALSFRSSFFQIRYLPKAASNFFHYFNYSKKGRGVHPLTAFFASLGGCVGVANIVGVCTAVQIGGPGALLWIWVAAILGMIVKYSEVYLGILFRKEAPDGTFSGGPMIFLKNAFGSKLFPILFSLLMVVYGVEVYQFNVICDTISLNYSVNYYLLSSLTILSLLYVGSGGVRRVGEVSTVIIPVFVLTYLLMGGWIILTHITEVPAVLMLVLKGAFEPLAVGGGVVGGGIVLAASQGIRRACYSSDIGIGYASMIHSESRAISPQKQASLVIIDVFIDTFLVCTTSILLILLTGLWDQPIDAALLVQTALSLTFPGMGFFMPLLLFSLGFSTITAYLAVGVKSAQFLTPKWGKPLFFVYAFIALVISIFVDTSVAQSVMAIAGGLLLLINSVGIYKLRKEISYSMEEVPNAVS